MTKSDLAEGISSDLKPATGLEAFAQRGKNFYRLSSVFNSF